MAAAAAPGLAQLAGTVAKLFGQAHAAAVAKEANALNQAVPPFVQGVQGLFDAVNSGQVDVQTAQTYIDSLVQQYYSAITPIMKKSGPCVFDQPMPTTCNGPCSVGCSYIERVSYLGKQLLQSAQPGTVTIEGLQPHAGFQGAPTLTLRLTTNFASLPGSAVSNPVPSGEVGVRQASIAPGVAAIAPGQINIGGIQVPRSMAILVGGGLAVILLLSLIGGSGSAQPQVVVVPPAGA